jgi:uncharacterized membrane protein YedE/YeeE
MLSKKILLTAFIYLLAGTLFGFGLAISGMTDPKVVQGFLDVFGDWNYSLLFVMAAAILLTSTGYKVIFKKTKPTFGDAFALPSSNKIDKPLIFGAISFGIGWGLYGLCPGPALASIASLNPLSLVFVVSMAVGMLLAKQVKPSQD